MYIYTYMYMHVCVKDIPFQRHLVTFWRYFSFYIHPIENIFVIFMNYIYEYEIFIYAQYLWRGEKCSYQCTYTYGCVFTYTCMCIEVRGQLLCRSTYTLNPFVTHGFFLVWSLTSAGLSGSTYGDPHVSSSVVLGFQAYTTRSDLLSHGFWDWAQVLMLT